VRGQLAGAVGKGKGMHHLRLPTALASFFCILFLSSCLSYEQVELQDITNVQVDQLDLKGIAVRIDARINNPNGYMIHLLDPDVDLFINGKFIGKGILDTALTLQKRSTQIYSIPIHAEVAPGSLLGLLLSGTLNSKSVKLGAKGTVVGKAFLVRKRFPFELEEEVVF